MARFWQAFKLPPAEEWPAKRVIGSYVLDWVIIVIIAAAGGGLNFVPSKERPFSLVDLSIAYPLVPESISVVTLGLVSLAAPAIIMAIVCLIVVPGPTGGRALNAPHALRRKLWEVYAAVTGLALSVAVAFFVTQGLKKAFGKPRPNFLAVCDPNANNIAAHVVGNYAQDLDIRWALVNTGICKVANSGDLTDEFQSFPSGHCSFAWSGLLYFSLFLCAKFSITIPYLPLRRTTATELETGADRDIELLPLRHPVPGSIVGSTKSSNPPDSSHPPAQPVPIYNQAAAPPTYGVVLVIIPLGVAAYIASTRFSEYYHDGFDVICGSLIGVAAAILSFLWYQLPLSRGQGWSWGPRSKSRAFGIGLGVGGYAGPEGWQSGIPAGASV